MTQEEIRQLKQNLWESADALRGNSKLTTVEESVAVKKVAHETLEKLKIERWRESRQIKAQVKNIINDSLLWLPQQSYTDDDVDQKSIAVYQHIYTSYYGGGGGVYQQAG